MKKIIELSKDRSKLKEERNTAAAYRKKLISGGTLKNELFKSEQSSSGPGRNPAPSYKRYVVDEEAYFNEQDRQRDEGMGEGKTILTTTKKETGSTQTPYDKFSEPNLAKKLGLAPETDEDIVGKKSDPKRKKTKEELEKEQDIAEVQKIISEGGSTLPDLSKYMREEVDLLGIDITTPAQPTGNLANGLGGGPALSNTQGGGNYFGAKPTANPGQTATQGGSNAGGLGNLDLLG